MDVFNTMKSKVRALLGVLLIASVLCQLNRSQSSNRLIRNDVSRQRSSIKENYVTVEKLRMRHVESGSGSDDLPGISTASSRLTNEIPSNRLLVSIG
jgi:hypothetical protein